MSDDWGEMADAALGESNKTNKPQATISNDDDWGTIADGACSGATKSVKPAADDDWGPIDDTASGGGSTKTVTSTRPANDDDWGPTSDTAPSRPKPEPIVDDWLTTNPSAPSNSNTTAKTQPVEDDWCSAGPTNSSNSNTTAKAQPVVDDWCSAGPTTPSRDNYNSGGRDDWGGNSTRKSGGRNDWGGNSTRKSGGRDDWGGNSTRKSGGGDDWGGNSTRKSGGGDDWGGNSTRKSGGGDDWGGNSTRKSGGGDDWGGNSTKKSGGGDDWGGTSTGNSGGGDDWGSTGNSGGGDDWGSTGNSGGRDRPNRNRNNNNGGDNEGNNEGGEERPAPYKPEQLNLEEEAELQAADAGENFQKYKEQVVNCIPPGIVEPVEKFDDVVESKLLLENLKKLKYTEMTPIQKWAMPAIKDGHDIIGCAQTGSGKTAAFLLPVLQTIMKIEMEPHDPNSDCQSPYCLIISPTRELAKQIYTHAELLSKDSIVKCRVIYGQVSTFHLKAQMSLGCHILVATMGKLKDFLERKWVDFKNIKWVILDEGDRLVDEKSGNDVNTIFQHETMPSKENRQTLFFSATFKESVQESAREFLRLPFIFLSVGRVGAANEDIRQEFIQVARENKKSELKGILKLVPPEDKTIVFTQTKAGADMLAAYFTSLKLESTSIHGDRHQSQREEAISLFRRGKKRFLISSPVGNRGLDLPKVTLVINYDLPECVDEYVHRIGRTGRAGHTGKAISFYDPGRDRELVPELLRILRDAKQEIPDWLASEETGLTAAPADDFFGTSEKRPADDEAGNESKKVVTGEQPAAAAFVEEEW